VTTVPVVFPLPVATTVMIVVPVVVSIPVPVSVMSYRENARHLHGDSLVVPDFARPHDIVVAGCTSFVGFSLLLRPVRSRSSGDEDGHALMAKLD
jgi:hypothetical protein